MCMFRVSFALIVGMILSVSVYANNVRINGDVKIVAADVKDNVATINFSVSWDNSWRDQFNHDGVYIFLKYKLNTALSEWHHVYLMDQGNSVTPNDRYELSLSKSSSKADLNEGIFVYPKKVGYYGTTGNKAEITLKWKITSNPDEPLERKDFEDGKVYVSAMAIEMVYVPRGAYRIGDTQSKNTFQEKHLYIPEKWDAASDSYYTVDNTSSSSSVVNPNPASFAVNRINDINNSARNAWKGTGTTNQWWQIDFGRNAEGNDVSGFQKKTIRYIAIESVEGYVPTVWKFQGTDDLSGGNWEDLYTGTQDDWITSLVRTYPPTKAIRVNQQNRSFRYYQILVANMAPSANPPLIKNIAMTEQDLKTNIYDNSVLINDSTILLSDQSGMHGLYSEDGDTWSGQSSSIYYPNGYEAFWTMKYELSQEQYVAFLNKLTLQQQKTRTVGAVLDGLKPGDYIFGKSKDKYTARNGIVLASRGAAGEPLVFANDLNKGDNELSQDGDGQTLACNFITPADMLAYADWCGLRPLSEMEYEKMSRRPFPDIPLRGEYAWNDNSTCNFAAGLTDGGKKTESITGGGNVNAGNTIKGPVRAGAFAATASDQVSSGASFWGVMDLSGNLNEVYYNINQEGRIFRGVQNVYHGTGRLDVNGNATLQITEWPRHQDAFALRGGSFNTVNKALLATSDRTNFKLNKSIELRDSTVSFRLGRTAPTGTIKSILTLQNGLTTAVAGKAIDTICSGEGYVLKGDMPAAVNGAYTIAWYVSENDGKTWDLIEGENGRDLRMKRLRNLNTTADQFKKYRFIRHLYSNKMDAKSDYAEVRVIDLNIQLNRLKDTIDVYNYSAGIESKALFPVKTLWKYGEDDWQDMMYVALANKNFLHYMRYDDFKVDGAIKTGNQQLVIRSDFFTNKCTITDTIDVYVKEQPEDAEPSTEVVCGGYMLDKRDSKTYKTIKIGTSCWMAENLNYNLDGSLCYGGLEENCNMYGRLYNWNQAAKNNGSVQTDQGVCPEGWHLPTNAEWHALAIAFNGKELKSSTDEWTYTSGNVNTVGSNATRFSALPGGAKFFSLNSVSIPTKAGFNSRNVFDDLGTRGWWWTSTIDTNPGYWQLASQGTTGHATGIPYYVRLDNSGNLVENVRTTVSTYAYLNYSVFVGTGNYNHLAGGTNDNTTALTNIQTQFYFSVRCVQGVK